MSYERLRNRFLNKYPSIQDLEEKAEKRIPHIAWAYLNSGTSREELLKNNIEAFRKVTFVPRFCKGSNQPNLQTTILGQKFNAPFGIAPVGLTGLMWPKAEVILAQAASKYQIPYCLSTMASETPETVGPHVGEMGWFQLYTPSDKVLRKIILERARNAGFRTLIVTVDIPIPARRERITRAGLSTPPRITPAFIWQGIKNPSWSIGTLKNGLPRLRLVQEYAPNKSLKSVGAFVQHEMRNNLTWERIKGLRDEWEGQIIVKGLLHPGDSEKAVEIGMEGIVVSNHGARQFDGGPASIEALPAITRAVKGKIAILFDSGIRSGLDILRALSLGAEFVLLGRAFIYGVAALGKYGGNHVVEILCEDVKNNMMQLGISSLSELDQIGYMGEMTKFRI